MLYKTDKSQGLIPENEFTARIAEITEELDKYAEKGFLKNGKISLSYAYINAENAKASVILLHGFTEFKEKYVEIAYYLLNAGYNVYIYDQRGHGDSTRETDDLRVTHINRFEDYSDDLERFITQVVEPNCGGTPLYFYAHSMGCAVAMLYMQSHPDKIGRAILSSPMVKPQTYGVPEPIVRYTAKKYAATDGWDTAFRNTKKDGEPPHVMSDESQSLARFRNLIALHMSSKNRQISGASNRWLVEALDVGKKLLNKQSNSHITARVLILSAENDKVVKQKPQTALAKTLSNCRFVTIKGAKHTIFTCCNRILSDYFAEVFEFLGE